MTDDKKHDDKDRKKLSDEEMEDVAGGQKIESQIGKAADQGDGMYPSKGKKNFRIGNKDGFG
jgi:hypothetical protein